MTAFTIKFCRTTLLTAGLLGMGITTASAADFTVHIKNYAYSPTAITVHKGDKITWINDDSIGHTVTADQANCFKSGNIAPGASWSHVFVGKGTHGYHCDYHPYMKGTVTVK